MDSKNVDQKVAIVTGSTSGIGETVARHLHQRGYRVALSGRRVKEGEAKASSLDASGETAIFVPCDVSSYASQSTLFRTVWDRWGRLDVLVANAGVVDRDSKYNLARRNCPVTDLPPEPNTMCTDINFKGVVFGTTLATHFMRHNPEPARGREKIIITGSVGGLFAAPLFPEYCAAKAAVLHWARTMAPLLKWREGITINVVLPCGTDSAVMPSITEAYLPEHLTLPECLLSAYDLFLDDGENEKTGMAVETAHDKLFFHDLPECKSGEVGLRTMQVYEPWFEYLHGERSGLEGALQGPPGRKQ